MPDQKTIDKNHQKAMEFISKLMLNMEFGTLQFEVKKFKGLVGQIVVIGFRSSKYDEPAIAIDDLAGRMEYLAKNSFTGTFSPAVIYKEGEITRVIFNEHHEIDLQKLAKSRKQT